MLRTALILVSALSLIGAAAPVQYSSDGLLHKSATPASPAPRLEALTPKVGLGETAQLVIRAPGWGGDTYMAAASLSNSDGFTVLGPPALQAGIDQDVLFWLTFLSPHPAVVSNFRGQLDASGAAEGLQLHVNSDDRLVGLKVYVQAIVLDSNDARPRRMALTNVAAFSISN